MRESAGVLSECLHVTVVLCALIVVDPRSSEPDRAERGLCEPGDDGEPADHDGGQEAVGALFGAGAGALLCGAPGGSPGAPGGPLSAMRAGSALTAVMTSGGGGAPGDTGAGGLESAKTPAWGSTCTVTAGGAEAPPRGATAFAATRAAVVSRRRLRLRGRGLGARLDRRLDGLAEGASRRRGGVLGVAGGRGRRGPGDRSHRVAARLDGRAEGIRGGGGVARLGRLGDAGGGSGDRLGGRIGGSDGRRRGRRHGLHRHGRGRS